MPVEFDNRNGQGFSFYDGSPGEWPYHQLFPEFADTTVAVAQESNGHLVTAGPGTGKSHLIRDIMAACGRQGIPSLALIAHLNGGSKKGVDNALYVLDEFTSRYGEDGMLIVDNIDYYGYSGSQASRRYSIAAEHTKVAAWIANAVHNTDSPAVCGTAHTPEWRDTHWKFGQKRAEDMVTPAATQLLQAFESSATFDGQVSESVAVEMLAHKIDPVSAVHSALAILKENTGGLYFRHINHLPVPTSLDNLPQDIEVVNRRTEALTGSATV